MSRSPSEASLAKSSSIMFSGTLVSRLLGFVRNALLVAVIGVAGANDAFTVANTLPNTVFNLLAGGVLNAILVPQIIRALRSKTGGDEYVNRLLTITGTLILGITVVATAAAPLLVRLFAGQMAPGWFNLAVIFAYWCLPQVFFYGVFALLSQVLNAHNRFGWPMWAPAINNVVGIIGLVAFLYLFSSRADAAATDIWGTPEVLVLAGSATLGVIVQALCLFPSLRKVGFHWRATWGLKGLGTASQVAMWAFAALVVGQIGFIGFSRVAAAANAAAETDGVFYPSTAAYTVAFMLSILPQSLITTSIVTAMFTRMSDHAAADDTAAVNRDLSLGMRTVGIFTILCSAGLIVLALPLVQAIAPTLPLTEASGVALVLAVLSLGVAGQGGWTMVQRVLFAYEDTKTMFLIQVPMAVFTLVGAYGAYWLAPPGWWVVGGAAGDVLAMYFGTIVGLLVLRRQRLPEVEIAATTKYYALLVAAVVPATLAGWGVLWLIGVDNSGVWLGEVLGATLGQLFGALFRLAVVALVMTAIYVVILLRLNVPEMRRVLSPVLSLLSRLVRLAPGGGKVAELLLTWRDKLAIDGPRVEFAQDPNASLVAEATSGIVVVDMSLVPRSGSSVDERYTLIRTMPVNLLGATRWDAEDSVTGVPVTLYMLLQGGLRTERMVQAAQNASRLTLPGVVRVYEAGMRPAFLAVERNTAPSLSRSLAKESLTPQAARDLVVDLARTLAAAAEQGVGHGALTPDDVFLAEDLVRVGGLEYRAAAEEIRYASPAEREKADVTTLVTIGYLALTRTWPGGGYGFVKSRERGGKPLPASEIVPEVDDALNTVIEETFAGAGPATFAELLTKLGEDVNMPLSGAPTGRPIELEPPGTDARPAGFSVLLPPPPEAVDATAVLPKAAPAAPVPSGAPLPSTGAVAGPQAGTAPAPGLAPPPSFAPGPGPAPAPSPGDLGKPPKPGKRAPISTEALPAWTDESERAKPFLARRVNPTPVVLLVLLVGVVAGLAWAVSTLLAPAKPIASDDSWLFRGPATPEATAPAEEGEDAATPAPADLGPAQIVSASVVDPGGDGDEHPELVNNLFDANSDTEWYSRFYNSAAYGNIKQGFGLAFELSEERTISQIRTEYNSTGGLVQVLVDGDTPADGKSLAQSALQEDLTLSFEPTKTKRVVLWFSELPVSLADGKFRVEIREVAIR
ncbi:murein biosynthesis integral membrane protein MurJ [Buchananella hordeovulneris]|uniref:murein biosynthesis integral membrane protein MurJ n=1 Tax=Buchananella hordeovulneris TaxID=52770 RepID=UPI000F5D9BEB|nr:murein biosynthesis integral membrane protein MurJ [Buchananella hordeovulneris]RRD43454.1 hypothetical protein EII13_07015 [Buchananella hordeovulneris]